MIKGLKEVVKVLLFKGSYLLNYPLFFPDTLQISLTSRCNLRCRMCSVSKYLTKPEEEMGFEEVSKIIGTAKKQFRINRIVITGGEPLLLNDLIARITKFANSLGMAVILTTNGYYLKEQADILAHSGVSHFHISVDGLEETHNNIRQNNSSFEKAIEGIKALVDLRNRQNLKFSIGIGMVILKNNIPELYELFLKADSLGVDVFDILPYLPDNTEFSSTTGTPLWPDENAVNLFREAYEKISKANTQHIRANDFIDAGLMAKYYLRRMHKRDWQCMAGFKNIFITMSDPKRQGRFEPCVFMCKAHLPVRDNNYDLKRIWYSNASAIARRDIKGCDVYCYQPCFSFPSLLKLLRVK